MTLAYGDHEDLLRDLGELVGFKVGLEGG